ncbi:MAG: 3'-5' exonuclease domain-containing protein 2 [Candidatus Omnitrophica bacterium]|nr:3'-5' exonuclease domain-containing protein 2 [Candidatus Omnitrophota bacterium]
MHRHTISKDEINALPLGSYTGPIHVIDSDEKMNRAARALDAEKVLGFDTETRPAFKKGESYPPSLIQLAASDGVYLFPLRHITSYKALAHILAGKKVLKAGIAIGYDLKKLNDIIPFKPSGFVELAELAAMAGIKNAGIRSLAAFLFGFRISKQTKLSRWDAPRLAQVQLEYAATDAWLCREIYFALLEKTGRSHG